ncbi:MAG: rod shape-determining protein MreC [Syntrophaceticus sp.]
MKRSSTLYKKIVVLLAVAVFCIALARLTSLFTGGVLFNELLAPVQGGITRVWHKAGDYVEYIGHARQISDENEDLRNQVRELTWENNRLQEYVSENHRLRELLDFKERYAQQYTLLGARVISRAPNTLSSMVVIDRGSKDGVQKNMVAVSNAGLVGKVIAVGPNTAEVLLILDREGAAGALVEETRTPGVVEGAEEGPGLLKMVSLPYDAKLQKGEMVVTSGMGGIFPPGLPIEKITKVEGSGINKFAVVQPLVDFDRLEELFLITESRQSQ